jgi:carbonic anhydrase/acetyltransferase-like protein (isoleucine patch superfamily)
MITGILKRLWRWHLRRRGLQMAPDCRFMGFPTFGSEPYLVSIGKHVTISTNVSFITHDGGTWVFRDQPRYQRVIKYGRIVIHDNCFIGARAIIMPGVSIGPNAVVAAGSIVTKSVPPDSVVAGVPAKFLSTVEEYAENALNATPDYDLESYRRHKQTELLRVLPMLAARSGRREERSEKIPALDSR